MRDITLPPMITFNQLHSSLPLNSAFYPQDEWGTLSVPSFSTWLLEPSPCSLFKDISPAIVPSLPWSITFCLFIRAYASARKTQHKTPFPCHPTPCSSSLSNQHDPVTSCDSSTRNHLMASHLSHRKGQNL